jgi:hypothetical protein
MDGLHPPPQSQDEIYWAAARDHLPPVETDRPRPFDAGARFLAQFEASTAQLVSTVRRQVDDLLTASMTSASAPPFWAKGIQAGWNNRSTASWS